MSSEPDGPFVFQKVPDFDAAQRLIREKDGVANLYFLFNVPIEGITAKPRKEDIRRVRGLHVDIDIAVGEERAAFFERARQDLGAGPLVPTVVIHTGNGVQALYLLDEPLEVPEEADRYAVEALNQALAAAVSGDACHNVDRLLRLPGTLNIPTERKRRRGLERQQAHVIEDLTDWDRRYGWDQLWAAFSPLINQQEDGQKAEQAATDAEGFPPELAEILQTGRHANANKAYPTRSEGVGAAAVQMIKSGVSPETAAMALQDSRFAISDHVLDQHNPDRYAARQIDRAINLLNTFEQDQNGRIIASPQNIRVALNGLDVRLRHDAFRNESVVEGLEGFGPLLDDPVVRRLRIMIRERFKINIPKAEFVDILLDEARYDEFHPLRDYFGQLQWDGEPRLDRWLSTYGGAEQNEYTAEVGSKALIAAVRRIQKPGTKFDLMPVMVGEQGCGKSSAVRLLVPSEDHFTDSVALTADDKLIIEATRGKLLVEVAELGGLKRADIEHVKAAVTRQVDRARLAYDKMTTEVPRQFILIGTTNSMTFLKDLTGNRRFAPVQVNQFDLRSLEQDRDQLWAEAAVREAAGESLILSAEAQKAALTQQEQFRIVDPWEDVIAAALGTGPCIITSDLVWQLVGLDKSQRNQGHNNRVGEVMRRLGFSRDKVWNANGTRNAYLRGSKDQAKRYVNFSDLPYSIDEEYA